jgi:type IV secretion system protein VirD4
MSAIRFVLILTVLMAAYATGVLIYLFPYAGIIPAVLVVAFTCRKGYRYTAYGTARWSTIEDIPHLLEGSGLILGYMEGRPSRLSGIKALFNSRLPANRAVRRFLQSLQRKAPVNLVRLSNSVHVAVFAPTGVGKGVSCILPFLLTCSQSCVIIDPKGENFKISADARRRMGHRVVRLDPFNVCGPGGDTFNPLHPVDRNVMTAIDECRDLAEAMVTRTGQEKDPHWTDAAEIWIASMIATTIAFAAEADKNLQSVRKLLTDPERMQDAIKIMCDSPDIWDGMLQRLGHQLTNFKDKELASTLTSTNRFMRFLDTVAIADNCRESSFDPMDLLTGKMTVYLILPPDHMRAQSPLLRLWIGSMLRAVVKGGLQEHTKVHFILDESASLGHMDALDDAVDKYRGYGIRCQFYYQSIGQLKKCWPDGQDQTLLSNVTQVFFGVNDQQTAEYVSARLGESTIIVSSGGTSSSTSHSYSKTGEGSSSHSTSTNNNWAQLGRKMLKPEEVATLDNRIAITFAPGLLPICTWLARYYEKSFVIPRPMGILKIAADTFCLFLTALMLAVVATGIIVNRTEGNSPHDAIWQVQEVTNE